MKLTRFWEGQSKRRDEFNENIRMQRLEIIKGILEKGNYKTELEWDIPRFGLVDFGSKPPTVFFLEKYSHISKPKMLTTEELREIKWPFENNEPVDKIWVESYSMDYLLYNSLKPSNL